MSDIVKKIDIEVHWGEDPLLILETSRRVGNLDIAQAAEKKILAGYLLRMRPIVELDPWVGYIIKNADPATLVKEELSLYFLQKPEFPLEEFVNKALDVLLEEIDEFRKNPAPLYIIDQETGKTLLGADERAIYQPPDYIGEDGKLHPARKILHPGISSSLALKKYDDGTRGNNLREIKERVKKNPKSEAAYAHLTDPNRILESMKSLLEKNGIQVGPMGHGYREEVVIVGREQFGAELQGINEKFHRFHMFASSAAIYVKKLLVDNKECELVSIEQQRNIKFRWYAIHVRIPGENYHSA